MTTSNSNQKLAQQLHQALRALRSPAKLARSPLLQSALLAQQQRANPTMTPVQLLCSILNDLHTALHHQLPLGADLLHGRFWEGVTAERMVQLDRPEPQSISRFYQQQEQAIQWLAQLWEEAERVALHVQQINQLVQRLPAATYSSLFGVEAVVQQVVAHLCDPVGPSIVTIKGIGGIGKTTAADCAIRAVLQQPHNFTDVVWISAKQEFLTPSGITRAHNGPATEIRLAQIFDDLGEKLLLPAVKELSLTEKVERLAGPLRHAPHLVVIDNLETVADFQSLVPWLAQLCAPTKFLLTSRETVPALAHVATIDLDEVDKAAAIALADYTATSKRVVDCDGEAVYNLVGGNPLAIILVVSQMRRLPPALVLETIRSGAAEELYTYIYHQSWLLISQPAKALLFTIQRAGDVAEWSWLELVHDGNSAALQATIVELMDFSLLYCQAGNAGERRYAIHRLTSTFLRTEILGWK